LFDPFDRVGAKHLETSLEYAPRCSFFQGAQVKFRLLDQSFHWSIRKAWA
jgi:hypothetical protein